MVEIISLVISILCLLVLLYIVFKKTPTSNGIDNALLDNKKQLEDLEKSFKNIYGTLLQTNKEFNDILSNQIEKYNKNVVDQLDLMTKSQIEQLKSIEARLNTVLQATENRLDKVTKTITDNLNTIQSTNEKKLEEMRLTVDEKLSSTLDKRLNESFKSIMTTLDTFTKNVGEIQNAVDSVSDLKKVLTNVKTRGGWGEVQLGNLLEQILSPSQYSSQVQIKANSQERVDFVINLPGKADGEVIHLPIDAKFPMEDYSRLITASESGDVKQIEEQSKNLERRIKDEAKKIKEKYINIPHTTDFAVLYLPVEGLYAEVVRKTELCDILQRDYKILVCGPTTLTSLLNSLQMGFKTLAIEKRSGEIWNMLSVFKQEFNKFVELISKTQKKLNEASNTIDDAAKKTRTIQRKLRSVDDIEGSEQVLLDDIDE